MNTLFLEKCCINLLTIPRAQHSYLTFRSGHHHTYTHLSRTLAGGDDGFTFVTDRHAVTTVSFAPASASAAAQQVPTQLERVTLAAWGCRLRGWVWLLTQGMVCLRSLLM